MAFNNNDHFQQLDQFFQTWEDEARSFDDAVRRLRSSNGIPVANMGQLDALDPQVGEGRFVKKIFDRFNPRLKPGAPPQT